MSEVVAFYREMYGPAPDIMFTQHDDTYAAAMNTGARSGWNILGIYDEPEGVRITVFVQ